MRNPLRRKPKMWWCGAGHETNNTMQWSNPKLPNEKFCTAEHLQSEIAKKQHNDALKANIPALQIREQQRVTYIGALAESVVLDITATAKCPRCQKKIEAKISDGRVTRMEAHEAFQPAWVEVGFTLDVGHECEPTCTAMHPSDLTTYRCTKPLGHDGKHGYAGIFWEDT